MKEYFAINLIIMAIIAVSLSVLFINAKSKNTKARYWPVWTILLAVFLFATQHDDIYLDTTNESSEVYILKYQEAPNAFYTDHLYIDYGEYTLIMADNDGNIVAPEEYEGKNVSQFPDFVKIEDDIAVSTEEDLNLLAESYANL